MSVCAKLLPVAVACGMAGSLAAQESEAPDLSFLEYLGSWQEGDDEWVVVAELAGEDSEHELDDEADDAGPTDKADDTDEQDESDDGHDGDRTDQTNAPDAD
jgi:hypothetical protein